MEFRKRITVILLTLTLMCTCYASDEFSTPPDISSYYTDTTRGPELEVTSSDKRSAESYDDPFTKSPITAGEAEQEKMLQRYPTASSDATKQSDVEFTPWHKQHTSSPSITESNEESALSRNTTNEINDLSDTSESKHSDLRANHSHTDDGRKVTTPYHSTFSGNPHHADPSSAQTISESNRGLTGSPGNGFTSPNPAYVMDTERSSQGLLNDLKSPMKAPPPDTARREVGNVNERIDDETIDNVPTNEEQALARQRTDVAPDEVANDDAHSESGVHGNTSEAPEHSLGELSHTVINRVTPNTGAARSDVNPSLDLQTPRGHTEVTPGHTSATESHTSVGYGHTPEAIQLIFDDEFTTNANDGAYPPVESSVFGNTPEPSKQAPNEYSDIPLMDGLTPVPIGYTPGAAELSENENDLPKTTGPPFSIPRYMADVQGHPSEANDQGPENGDTDDPSSLSSEVFDTDTISGGYQTTSRHRVDPPEYSYGPSASSSEHPSTMTDPDLLAPVTKESSTSQREEYGMSSSSRYIPRDDKPTNADPLTELEEREEPESLQELGNVESREQPDIITKNFFKTESDNPVTESLPTVPPFITDRRVKSDENSNIDTISERNPHLFTEQSVAKENKYEVTHEASDVNKLEGFYSTPLTTKNVVTVSTTTSPELDIVTQFPPFETETRDIVNKTNDNIMQGDEAMNTDISTESLSDSAEMKKLEDKLHEVMGPESEGSGEVVSTTELDVKPENDSDVAFNTTDSPGSVDDGYLSVSATNTNKVLNSDVRHTYTLVESATKSADLLPFMSPLVTVSQESVTTTDMQMATVSIPMSGANHTLDNQVTVTKVTLPTYQSDYRTEIGESADISPTFTSSATFSSSAGLDSVINITPTVVMDLKAVSPTPVLPDATVSMATGGTSDSDVTDLMTSSSVTENDMVTIHPSYSTTDFHHSQGVTAAHHATESLRIVVQESTLESSSSVPSETSSVEPEATGLSSNITSEGFEPDVASNNTEPDATSNIISQQFEPDASSSIAPHELELDASSSKTPESDVASSIVPHKLELDASPSNTPEPDASSSIAPHKLELDASSSNIPELDATSSITPHKLEPDTSSSKIPQPDATSNFFSQQYEPDKTTHVSADDVTSSTLMESSHDVIHATVILQHVSTDVDTSPLSSNVFLLQTSTRDVEVTPTASVKVFDKVYVEGPSETSNDSYRTVDKSVTKWKVAEKSQSPFTHGYDQSVTMSPRVVLNSQEDSIPILIISISIVVSIIALIAIVVTCICYNNSDSLRRMKYSLGSRSGTYMVSDEIALGTPGRMGYKGDHAYKNYYGNI